MFAIRMDALPVAQWIRKTTIVFAAQTDISFEVVLDAAMFAHYIKDRSHTGQTHTTPN